MTTTIEAVIWDFGGVVTTSPFEAFNRFEARHNLPRDFIRSVNATNPDTNAWAQFEASTITIDEFDELFAAETARAGHRLGGRQVVELLAGDLRPRMVEVLKQCKQAFRIACITNNLKSGQGPGMVADAARAQAIAAVMELFDVVIESSKEGIRKPNPRIYELACERLDVSPRQAVFLDDLGGNLKPARAMGMHTIKVLDEAQAITDLAAVTGLAL